MNAFDTATQQTAEILHAAIGNSVDDVAFRDLVDAIVEVNGDAFIDSTLAAVGLDVETLVTAART